MAVTVDVGETYQTDKSCQKFITATADDPKVKQNEVFASVPFLSIISDASNASCAQNAQNQLDG